MVEVWEILEADQYHMAVQAYRDGNYIWSGAVHYQTMENTAKRDGALIIIPKGGNPKQRLVQV